MSEIPQVPTAQGMAMNFAKKNPIKTGIAGLVVASLLSWGGFTAVKSITAKDVNAAGVKETTSFVVQSGKEFPAGIQLDSSSDWKGASTIHVWVKNKSLLPGGLEGVKGKKIHVFTPLVEYKNDQGYKKMEHVVQNKDDLLIE